MGVKNEVTRELHLNLDVMDHSHSYKGHNYRWYLACTNPAVICLS
ncbi:hypothetical protein HanRHA438_Chr15g0700631 [Helianthus annuus]|nr:hypothetical protein HanIR_Chr15g0747941 [Helianthus annuus]KAJ0844277.1 hypothetical protein HanRHA438_Chr15g0700631 [Helianthus annuus]